MKLGFQKISGGCGIIEFYGSVSVRIFPTCKQEAVIVLQIFIIILWVTTFSYNYTDFAKFHSAWEKLLFTVFWSQENLFP